MVAFYNGRVVRSVIIRWYFLLKRYLYLSRVFFLIFLQYSFDITVFFTDILSSLYSRVSFTGT